MDVLDPKRWSFPPRGTSHQLSDITAENLMRLQEDCDASWRSCPLHDIADCCKEPL